MNLDNILPFNWTSITTYFHPVIVDIVPKNISLLFDDCLFASRSILQFIGDHLSCPIEFSDFQIVLLAIFLGFIFVNIVLIVYYWNKYGGVITDRFIRPSEYYNGVVFVVIMALVKVTLWWLTQLLIVCQYAMRHCARSICQSLIVCFCFRFAGTLKEIEELKLSVAKLKLPFEHTPRI